MNLAGKNVIVTGANTGIGRMTAVDLARQKARVFLACRSEERTRPVLDEIAAAGGQAELMKLDLADLANVRAAAEGFLTRDLPLTVLVNNAGLAGAHGVTKNGFEIAFGTNHVGPYLFTRLLLPALERATDARVVNVSSEGHYRAAPIDWEALRAPTRSGTGFPEYCTSKLANVLFSNELARRFPKVSSYALHPGTVATDVWREVPWGLRHVIKLFMRSNEQGAKTTLYCATSDDAKTGRYYDDSKEKKASPKALDEALAKELWDRSAGWVGLAA